MFVAAPLVIWLFALLGVTVLAFGATMMATAEHRRRRRTVNGRSSHLIKV